MSKSITGLLGCITCITGLLFNSCQKQDNFLDAKPNQALKTPTTLADLRALLQNEDVFNNQPDPGLGQIASDDFLVQDQAFEGLPSDERNAFTWRKLYLTLRRISHWTGANPIKWSITPMWCWRPCRGSMPVAMIR